MSVYLDKIKQVSKLNISQICNELKINRANLLNGRTTVENEKKVYNEIVKRIEKIIK